MARQVLGIDVGGSSVKAGRVDVAAGRLSGRTDLGADPAAGDAAGVAGGARGIWRRELPSDARRVGIAFPSVIKNGIDAHGRQYRSRLDRHRRRRRWRRTRLGRPVLFLNDADAAGLAEMRWGAGRGVHRHGHHADLRYWHRHRAVLRRPALSQYRARTPGAARHGCREVGLGARAHRSRSSTFRRGSSASTSTWPRCTACSGPTCSSSGGGERALRRVCAAAALARPQLRPAHFASQAGRHRRGTGGGR